MKNRIAARLAAGVFLAAALLTGSAATASADEVQDLFNYCQYIKFNSPLCSDF